MRRDWLFALLLLPQIGWSAIAFVNGSTADSASATSLTPTEPTSTAQNNLVWSFCSINSTDGVWTDPADFTEIAQGTGSVSAHRYYYGYKVRGATAGSGYQFDYSGTAAQARCTLLTFSGNDTSAPWDVTFVDGSHHNTAQNDLTIAAPAITTVTDGAWVIVSQHFSGGIGGVTAGVPSGYTSRESNLGANRSHINATIAVATAATETPGAWTTTGGTTQDGENFTFAIRPASTGISFSSGPTIAAATNGYTISGTITCTGTCTVYAVAQHPSVSAPTCTQIKAGQDGAGSSAPIAANEAWTSGMADSFALTAAGAWPIHDVHICGSDGTTDTAVTSSADELRSADSGQAIQALSSISVTSTCDLDSYFDPDVAIGDYIEYDTTSDNTYTVTLGADCDFSIAAMGDTSRDFFDLNYFDYSTGGDFSAGPPAWASGDDRIYVNNSAPQCEDFDVPLVLTEDMAMSSIDLNALCTDFDSDALTFAVTTGTLPNGTSLGGTGNGTWSGTPDTEDETGVSLTFTATDVAGDTDTFTGTVYVVNTVTMPTLTDSDLTAALADYDTAFPWAVGDRNFVASFACSKSEAANQVLTQDPAALAEVAYNAAVSISVSSGPCGLLQGSSTQRPRLRLGL